MRSLGSLLAVVGCLLAAAAHAGTVRTDVPPAPDPDKIHLIYLHGRIIENEGPRPTDARFGRYDYAGVLDALSSRGAVVVSAQRPPGTDVNAYAGLVVAQVERLIREGLPPERIVVAGFSKGGDIAIRVSSFLRRPQLRYVLLAACWDRSGEPHLRLTGKVFSIHETSDTLAGESCRSLAERDERPQSFEEKAITTGRSHGAFYAPLDEWVDPVLAWVHGK